MRAIFTALVITALAGCFDPDKASGNTDAVADSGTGNTPCTAGSSGCACYGNSTCDSGLACNATVELCIPEDCAPGSEACTCNDGACLTGLECNGGVCTQPGASSDPVTTDPATSDPVTTDPVTTDAATTDPTDPATSDPLTTDPATSDPATTDPTGTCAGDCTECLQCAVGGGNACDVYAIACSDTAYCPELLECCATNDAELCGLCCADYPDAVTPFLDLVNCINAEAFCSECPIASC